jgi:imidazolonepropionase-like amidohydrolase
MLKVFLVLFGLIPTLFASNVTALTAASTGNATARASVTDTPPRTLIHAGTLIDGFTDAVRTEVTLTIEEGRIQSIRNGFIEPDPDDHFIDLSNHTVLPGLIDLHVHFEATTSPTSYMDRFTMNESDVALRAAHFALITLEAGFTTVRDLGGNHVNTSLRNAVRDGLVPGPRILSVGKSLATTGGHADPTNGWRRDMMGSPGPDRGVVNGESDARQAVRQAYKNGADHIKITATGGVLSLASSGQNPQFMDDELEAIVQTANDYGMHVAAHAHGRDGMLRAVQAGVHTIEHGTYMDETVMQAMVEHGTWYVPTITAGKWVAEMAEIDGYYPPVVRPKAREIGPLIQNTFAEAYRYGVRIAFGTDAGVFPHGLNAREFIYMTEAGMPEMEAIQSATYVAAAVLGLERELGSLQPGLQADIIAVPGNPLEDISVLTNVRFVMKGGKVYRHAE